MAIPKQPDNLLPCLFAGSGNYRVLPEAETTIGRASFAKGFPAETQQPLADGGVAPNRLDINGVLHMLSGLGHWQQSGGQWSWKSGLNYSVPALVYHTGKLWWCLKENGPESAMGAVEPGSDEDVWEEFLLSIAGMTGDTSILGNPVGTILSFYGANAPQGYFACDGGTFSATMYPKLYTVLGSTTLPDYRGMFLRGYGQQEHVKNNGVAVGNTKTVHTSGEIGEIQGDATRNWSFTNEGHVWMTGAIAVYTPGGGRNANAKTGSYFNVNLSRVCPTANEIRPVNSAILYCIKHD